MIDSLIGYAVGSLSGPGATGFEDSLIGFTVGKLGSVGGDTDSLIGYAVGTLNFPYASPVYRWDGGYIPQSVYRWDGQYLPIEAP